MSLDGKIASGSKEGKACATSWMGVFAMGDASVETAARNGGITRVKSVEALINARIVMGRSVLSSAATRTESRPPPESWR